MRKAMCDCERGHNGFGMVGRECDCQDPRPRREIWTVNGHHYTRCEYKGKSTFNRDGKSMRESEWMRHFKHDDEIERGIRHGGDLGFQSAG